jgi:glycosyltransferase involved in cell wall biosynthesis
MKKITVIIPALNEEQGIGLVLREIPVGSLKDMGFETEVMVIDNGSIDRTRHIAMQHGATVIIQPMRGYGNAYKVGFTYASGDIIVTGDADLTYPCQVLNKIDSVIR